MSNEVNKIRRYEIEYWDNLLYKGEPTNYWISTTGKIMNKKTGLILHTFISNSGYERATICVNHKKVKVSIHRTVSMTFIPIPEKYKKVGLGSDELVPNHKDGNKLNNQLYNLEWMTTRENTIDAIINGLAGYIGENSHLAKMTHKTAVKCCELLAVGKSFAEISTNLGISTKMVKHIKYGECWKEVSKDYEFPINDNPKPNSVPVETIHEICKLLEEKKYTDKSIASKFGITREYVRDIRNHKRQKQITAQYNF